MFTILSEKRLAIQFQNDEIYRQKSEEKTEKG